MVDCSIPKIRKMNRASDLIEYEVVQVSVSANYANILSQKVVWLSVVGNYSRRLGQRRKRCTNDRHKCFIRQYALRSRTVSSVIRNELETIRNDTSSSETVGRRLIEAGLNSRSATAPLLTRENRIAGLHFDEITKIGL